LKVLACHDLFKNINSLFEELSVSPRFLRKINFGEFGKENKFIGPKLMGFLASKVSYLVKGNCENSVGFLLSKIGHQIREIGEEIEVKIDKIRRLVWELQHLAPKLVNCGILCKKVLWGTKEMNMWTFGD